MGRRYSYSQPSSSDEYGGEIAECGYSSTEELIRQDQAELSSYYGAPAQYPPQPEVEFGFPQKCYCGGDPILATSLSKNDPGRRYYTCEEAHDGECHVWKWWDVAVMEEMRERDRQLLQLAEKVDNLTYCTDFETEHKIARLEQDVCDLSKKKSNVLTGFEVYAALMLIVVVILGLVSCLN